MGNSHESVAFSRHCLSGFRQKSSPLGEDNLSWVDVNVSSYYSSEVWQRAQYCHQLFLKTPGFREVWGPLRRH